VRALNLSDEQRHKIENLVQQGLKRREELTKQLSPLQRTISDLLSQPELDEQKVWGALATQLELRNARRKGIIAMRVHVRQALTVEQFKKLLELNPRIMRQRWVKPQPRVIHLEKPSRKEKEAEQHDEEDDDGDDGL